MIEFILSQVFGGLALILVCISYITNDRRLFLLLNVFANVFSAAAFITQDLIVAGINTVISIARTLGLFILSKNNTKPDFTYLFLIIAAYFINLSIFFKSPTDFVVLFTSSMFTIAFFSTNMRFTRIIVIIPNLTLTVYNIVFHLYTSAALNFIEACVAFAALIKNDYKFPNRAKQKNRQT